MTEHLTDTASSSAPAATSSGSQSLDLAAFGKGDLSFGGLLDLRAKVFASPSARRSLVDALPQLSGVQHGVALWILDRKSDAVEPLGKARDRSEGAEYCWADCLLEQGEYARASQTFAKLAKASPDEPEFQAGVLRAAEAEFRHGEEATMQPLEKALQQAPKAFLETAHAAYFRGRLAEMQHDPQAAMDAFDSALAIDPGHRPALERKAFLHDLRGQDSEAIAAYERLVELPPVSARSLASLGLLYEDMGKATRAMACFRAILEVYPEDPTARLHLTDARASSTQSYDEELERKEDKLQQILRIPITDFELSVRARNCLNRMEIQTLGDLVKKSEVELLSYKNFGETSLNEIKDILRANGLRLGMEKDDGTIDASKLRTEVGPSTEEAGEIPISELQLSVRSRRTVDRLGCKTVGDLARKSEAELLAQPNFGHTSLNEIKHKLENLGLHLAKR